MLSMLMTTEYAPAEDRHELQQLLIHIAGGEREALAELYQRMRSAVYGLALSYLKNAQDAQNLTQDVYVQVWDRAEQYRPTGSPMGWLLAVCRNLCLTRLRREERHAALSEEEWDAIPARECGLDADERTLLQGALASLTDEERRIVLLHAVTGLKHREIAALLELPLPTVLSKYHRALKNLLLVLESMETKQNKQRHQEGVARAKNSGKYVGRKKLVVDPNLFRQVAEDFRSHKIAEKEAMYRTGISSRSTFYRRLKEI